MAHSQSVAARIDTTSAAVTPVPCSYIVLVSSSYMAHSQSVAARMCAHCFIATYVSLQVYVLKRPYVDEYLQKMGELFECVLFTASLAKVSTRTAWTDAWGR